MGSLEKRSHSLLLKAMEKTTWLSVPRDKPETLLKD